MIDADEKLRLRKLFDAANEALFRVEVALAQLPEAKYIKRDIGNTRSRLCEAQENATGEEARTYTRTDFEVERVRQERHED